MKITVTFMSKRNKSDYMINGEMTIRKALEIISKNGHFDICDDIQYLYSERKQECISVNLSFHQAEIYSGDILKITQQKGGQEFEYH